MKYIRLFIGVVIATFLFANSVLAQSAARCDTREKVVDQLQQKYKEVQRGLGILANGALIEIFVSEDGSFSFLATTANGPTCLVAVGQNFHFVKAKPIKPKGDGI